jgi:hypothetical protein
MKRNEFFRRRRKGDSLLLDIEEQNRLLFGEPFREIK